MALCFQFSLSPPSLHLASLKKSYPNLSNRKTNSLPILNLYPKKFPMSAKCSLLKEDGNFQQSSVVAENGYISNQDDIIQPSHVVAKYNNLKEDVSWLVRLLDVARPYIRLARIDNMFSTWLHGTPYFWSIALATSQGQLPDIGMLGKFVFPIMLTTSIINTINDIIDVDLDRKVERSKGRPLASGDISLFQGICFLVTQLLLVMGYGILVPFNNYSRFLMAMSFPLHFAYPFMKRITYWPQAYLGLTLNWGILVGWAAVKGRLDLSIVLPLYIAATLWTLVYDTIYAHQDIKEDPKAGIKSTALLFGDSTKKWTSVFAAGCIACLAICGVNSHIGWPFYAFLAAAAAHFTWQISTVDLSNPNDCLNKFLSAKWIAAAIFHGIIFGRLV